MTTDSERIDGLESQLAFQDETIQQMNHALVRQQRRIDVLQVKLDQLLAMTADAGDSPPSDGKPPHY